MLQDGVLALWFRGLDETVSDGSCFSSGYYKQSSSNINFAIHKNHIFIIACAVVLKLLKFYSQLFAMHIYCCDKGKRNVDSKTIC